MNLNVLSELNFFVCVFLANFKLTLLLLMTIVCKSHFAQLSFDHPTHHYSKCLGHSNGGEQNLVGNQLRGGTLCGGRTAQSPLGCYHGRWGHAAWVGGFFDPMLSTSWCRGKGITNVYYTMFVFGLVYFHKTWQLGWRNSQDSFFQATVKTLCKSFAIALIMFFGCQWAIVLMSCGTMTIPS